MRLPNGLVNRCRQLRGRVLARHRAEQPRRVLAARRGGRLARALAGRSQARLEHVLAKHSAERLGRLLVVGLVVLMGGGTAAALAVLPSDERATAAGAGGPAAAAQSHRFAVGRLAAQAAPPRRAGPSYYRKTASRRVSASTGAGFMPLYREAAATFGVSWRLLASIHRQETAFSTAPSTYHGLNAFGCCAGPMQFNVTNGPPSTWALYRQSYRRGDRPRRYPHRMPKHPSIYDDFDAIMAAGALLRDSGATEALDAGSWSAAYAYYGHDLFGIDYASQVMGRARMWERDGFCLNCAVDDSLVAKFDDAYGVDARRQMLGAERREKQEKKRKKRRQRARAEARKKQARAEARRKAAEQAQRKRPRRSSPGERRRPAPADALTETSPNPPSSTATDPPTTGDPPPPEQPADADCTAIKRLLGCG